MIFSTFWLLQFSKSILLFKEVDDNCGLMFLNEATLLNNVRLRYKKVFNYGIEYIYLLESGIVYKYGQSEWKKLRNFS